MVILCISVNIQFLSYQHPVKNEKPCNSLSYTDLFFDNYCLLSQTTSPPRN